ncbi:MAG TPA: ATP-binding cassette domain-containing protein [Pirellulales bacterium]|nr:ATP-binding cassette domain-containing protein [Pirellulales bacterium]
MAGVILENVSRVYPGASNPVRVHRGGPGDSERNAEVQAVRDLSLEVRDREFLVLVGPSGCGKTTTLRLIAGLEELSSGKITIGTRVVNDVSAKDRDIAMVFQNYALYPHLTVYKNLAFGLELREKLNGPSRLWQWALPARAKADLAARRFAVAERVHETARTLGIEVLLDRLPRQLSGGERQRVALGRAIVRNPAVFLFDEPLSNLDAKLRVEMRRELKQLHQRLAATMIYVTHDQVEALTLGDRIVVMNEGRIQQVGKPMDLYDWPANRFVAGFIGAPAMNFIEGELTAEADQWRFGRGDWSITWTARPELGARLQPAVLGVRPEHVHVEQDPMRPIDMHAVARVVEMLGDATVVTCEVATRSPERHPTAQAAVRPEGVMERENVGGPAGPERVLHKEETFCVVTKMGPRTDLRPGDRVGLRIDRNHIHLFDAQTGDNRLRPSVAA